MSQEPMEGATREQKALREQVAQHAVAMIESVYEPSRVWLDEVHVGPMGGESSRVLAAVEHEGRVEAVTVLVYSDGRIDRELRSRLEAERLLGERDAQLRRDLGWATDEPDPEAL